MKYIHFLFLTGLFSSLMAQESIPEKPTSWVNDYYGILKTNEQRVLESKLSNMERNTSTQIFIAIFGKIPEGYYLEDFTVKLYEKWRPGREKEDNGVLIVVFIDDRQIRIEVGYGLEGVLTDLQAGRVIDDVIKPYFQQEDYFTGLDKGVDIIIAAVKGEYNIPVEKKSSKGYNWITLFLLFIIITSIFKRFGSRGTTISGRGYRSSRTSLGGPFIFWGGGSGGGSSFGGGGGFSGGFGGLSGGGGASGSW